MTQKFHSKGNANAGLHKGLYTVFTTALFIIATNWKQHTRAWRSGIFIQQTTIRQLKKHTDIHNIDKSQKYHTEPDTTALCNSIYMKLIFRYRKGGLDWVLRRELAAKRHEWKIKGNENIFYAYCAGITKHISQTSLNRTSKFGFFSCVQILLQ